MQHFPFSAIIGLELAQRALLYHAIDQKLKGILLFGSPGCAKSTLARSFGQLLGAQIPFIETPLGVSEDRLLGSVDAEKLVEKNQWQVRQGLLGAADGGILYVDEINLLTDSLADCMLDAAASGAYQLERDGISKRVQSEFMLLGSMNPEEGELRPQLKDRFAHGVLITDQFTTQQRKTILHNRFCFDEKDPQFLGDYTKKDAQIQASIKKAQTGLKNIQITDELLERIAEQAQKFKISGLRTEIAVLRTARAAAALKGQTSINQPELQEAWALCLAHRQPENLQPPHNTQKPTLPNTPKNPAADTNQNTDSTGSTDSTKSTESKTFQNSLQTSKNPKTAHQQAIILPPAEPHNPHLKFKPQLKPLANKKRLGFFSSHLPATQINWVSTSIHRYSKKRWALQWRTQKNRPQLFMLLDASRSSGSSQFLQSIRTELLAVCKTAKCRFNLLLIINNQVKWECQNVNANTMQACLNNIQEASGASFLHEALNQLYMKLRRQPLGAKDQLWFVSDGLFTLNKNQDLNTANKNFRQALQWLCSLPAPLIWLHPKPQYGTPKVWLSLTRGLNLQLVQGFK